MSRRVTLAVLLAGMTVSAIIIIITISNSINNQRIRAEQMAESAHNRNAARRNRILFKGI